MRQTAFSKQVNRPMTHCVTSLRDMLPRYDGFLIDLWGVMHDGVTAFPEAVRFVQAARAAGKPVGFLSNSSSRAAVVAAQLHSMGITDYTTLITSGELVSAALTHDPTLWRPGYAHHAVLIGDTALFNAYQAPVTLVQNPAQAGAIINVWYSNDQVAGLAACQPALQAWLAQGLPMICCNPDYIAHTAGVPWLCPGALAADYAALGGTVHYFGKPYAAAFAAAVAQLGLPATAKVVMIGDNLNTDMRGGQDYGLETILILDGVHRQELGGSAGDLPSAAALQAVCAAHARFPDWAVPNVRL
jgi:HAD superfamily hydrolase (TIGR01459 family)